MHFFSPAHIMPLVECIRGADTSAMTIAAVMGTTKQLKKVRACLGCSEGCLLKLTSHAAYRSPTL